MAKTPRRGASHQDSNAPAHFVPLAVIIDEYDGVLGPVSYTHLTLPTKA